jgi:hypothetical protein
MENNKWEKLVSKHLVGRKIVKSKYMLSAKESDRHLRMVFNNHVRILL